MAYQDDFRNKVLAALKAKNLAVDISQEATQQAIVQEAQNVAKAEATLMTAAEMKSVLEDVAKELSSDKNQFTVQNYDFTAFEGALEGPLSGGEGSYSGGGIAVSVANKDIIIIPSNGGLGAAGSATSVNSISQIDFKLIANPNAYATNDPREVKASLYNWGERVAGNAFDTPVLGLGGAWNGVSYAPTPQWGVGNSFGSGVGGSINQISGFGQIIFFKPASSTIYASLFNDVAISSDFTNKYLTLIGYDSAVPGNFPSAGFAVSFGGIGNSGPLAISGAATHTQLNRVRFLSPLTISNSTASDTLTLGLSTAIPTTENFVGGGNAQYVLSTTSASFSQGDIFYASATGHTHLIRLPIGGNNTYLTSNGSVPSWTGSIAANTVAVNAATGSTILYPLLNNIAGSGAAISTDIDFNVDPGANILRYATGSFYVGTAVSSPLFTTTGDVSIRPGANSTTGIQLDNLAGQPILNVDTNNSRVSIGSNVAAPNYTLDVSGDTNISSGSVFRINGTSVLSNNTLGTGVLSSSLTSVGTISTGTWAATAITAHYGGTGLQTPFAIGDLLFANTITTLSRLAAVATGSVLASQGTGTAPAYVATSTLSVGTAVTANNINLANATTAGAHFLHFSPTATGTGIATSTNTTISYNPNTFILSTSGLAVTNTTATTTTTSGALIVSGGMGLAGNAFIGSTVYVPSSTPSNFSNLLVSNTTATTSTTSGALVVSGGLGIAGNAFIGSTVYVPSSTPSNFSNLLVSNNTATTSTTSGALVVSGGLGIAGNAFIGGTINVPSTSTSNISNVTFANGIVTAGVWQGTAVGTTYGGTGSNLGPGGGVGNSNRIVVTGGSGPYAATLINNATSGNLLVSGGALAAPTFTNTTNADFTFNGTLNIATAAITNGTITGTPTNANDIVNKSYADSISGGLDVHASARLTTISAIGGSYRQSGSAGTTWGIGDYIIATTPGALIGPDAGWDTVGIALTNGQRVLVKDGVLGGYASGAGAYGAYPTTYGGFAASWVANGIYEVRSYGGAATSGWLLVRATDTDNQNGVQELTGGTFLFIEEGANYADHAFVCSNDTTSLGPIGFGSTQISWTLFAGGNTLIAGQGLVESGNNLALLFNLVQANSINSNLSRGFTLGGTRAASLGSSSFNTLTVTGSSDSIVSSNTLTATTDGWTLAGGATSRTFTFTGSNSTLTGAADGFTLSAGTSARTLTVIGGNITVANGVFNGGGFGLTLSSNATLNLNTQTLTMSANMRDLTFQAGNTTPVASTQNIVQSGAAQYNLSTSDTTFSAGDIYYGAGAAYTSLSRLAFGSGTGNSVLIRGANAPAWGTIALGNSNFVSGTLTTTNGGTSNGSLSVTNGQVVYTDGNKLATTAVGTADQFLKSAGSGAPVWSAITLSNTTSVTGTLGISNGGTNATATPTNGGISYGTGTAYAFTGAGTANSVLLSTGAGAPIWGAVVLSSSNSVTGTLGISNGGTNSTATPTAGGAVYGTGTAYAITGQGTAGNVLISAGASAPSFSAITLSNTNSVTGTLGIANGGTNAGTANFTTNGVVIYDGTRLASATGITMTGGVGLSVNGTTSSTGGFFIAGNSVISSITSNTTSYGAITITSAASNGGTSYFSNTSSSITLNYPGTGITGTGSATQVPYYSASSTLTGDVGLVYSRTAATGIGLSLNINASTGTILRVNSAQAFTSGLLLDVDNNGTAAYTVDWKGMATHTASASGNTALVVSGGRTILPAPTANYASLNLAASSAVNPGAGITQIGDLWFNGTNLYFRKDATTNFDLLVGSVSGSGTANRIAKWSTSSALTDSNLSESASGVGMTITSTSSIAAGGGTTALLTLQTIVGDNSAIDRYFVRGVTSTGTRLFSIDTSGNLRATTKSFDIPHPTKEGVRLVYGVLEGPEHGVYHRGTVEGNGIIQINLPEYWHKLVGDQYTIQLTPWGNYNVCINSKTENYFTIQLVGDFISRKFKNIKVDYIVHGSRLDAPLETEQ